MIGKIIQNYKILSKIGEGGMGTVYLAEDTMLDKQVAIKALNPILSTDSQFLQRFRQEAKLQASLDHGNIIRIYTMLKEEDRFLIVMEYAKGKNLRDIILEEGAIEEKRALKIMEEVLHGLNYAHKRRIIHRDIKPVNIMITDNDYVKIMDFGIAKLLGDSQTTLTKGIIGTYYYMSPEYIRSPKSVNIQTDLYSLGITFYEILTGKLPFNIETDSEFELLSELIRCVIPDLTEISSSISKSTADIVKKLTEKDLSKRYKNCDECLQDVRNRNTVKETPVIEDKTDIYEKTIIKIHPSKNIETVLNKEEKEPDYINKEFSPGKTIKSKLPDEKEDIVKNIPAEKSRQENLNTIIDKDEKIYGETVQEIKYEKDNESKLPYKNKETVKFTPVDKTTLDEDSVKKEKEIRVQETIIPNELAEKKVVQDTIIEKEPVLADKKEPARSKRKYYYIGSAVIAVIIAIFIINPFNKKENKEPDKNVQTNTAQTQSLIDVETLKSRLNDYLIKAYSKTELSGMQDSKMELSSNYKFNTADDVENKANYNPFGDEYKNDAEFILNFKGMDSLDYNPEASSKFTGIYKIENSDLSINAKVEGETNRDKITKIENILYSEIIDLKPKPKEEKKVQNIKKQSKDKPKTDPSKYDSPKYDPPKKDPPKTDPPTRPPK